ncbi:MAG: molecular chaperone HscB [Polaribacter sp.]|jgi:molecular chaperone HscB
MTLFEFYNIPITFIPDEAALRKTFYANSKKYHPDFYTLASEAAQEKALELSTLNNEAFKTLSDLDRRIKYILELKGAMGEEGQNNMPQDFLMEMMDINEGLMELEFDYDAAAHQKVVTELEGLEKGQLAGVLPVLESYVDGESEGESLAAAKGYYFKMRYLLRIRKNLDKFASL